MKRPAFQFYPADWRKDPALSACSLAARGLWIELVCIAHESEEYGYLTINGKAMNDAQLARLVGESPKELAKLLAELEQSSVFSRDERGAIFSRRMVKDEHIRKVRAEAGRLGGNPDLIDKKDKQIAQDLLKQNGEQILTPSSSSSTSVKTPPTPKGDAVKFDPLKIELPACIPADVWTQWVTHRVQIKKRLTELAAKEQLAALARWHADGFDPTQIIKKSVTNGWTGLFEPDKAMRSAQNDDHQFRGVL